ncbi:MAG: YggS family pyridoxal phosphate-dependent enzyme [Gammaproteobacteria bacterium]
MTHPSYVERYLSLIEGIKKLEKNQKRKIRLVAVSKKQTIDKIIKLRTLGHLDFGENYVDEAFEKKNNIKDDSIKWHFIGNIQSNKIKKITNIFDWVHTVSSFKHAHKLNDECKNVNKIMNICVQINIDKEIAKGGIALADYDRLASDIKRLEHINLRGVMTIPQADKPCSNSFHEMYELYMKYDYLDTLSMGMSSDFLTAIENGANMLRIGQGIFGKRI